MNTAIQEAKTALLDAQIKAGIPFKMCRKCKVQKPLVSLNAANWCNDCVRDYSHKHYLANKEKILIRTKKYYIDDPERAAQIRKDYYEANKEELLANRKTLAGRTTSRDYIQSEYGKAVKKESRARNWIQIRAREQVSIAIHKGKLTRQPCEVCSTTTDIHAHHDDYTQPLSVRWLCASHHRQHHQQLKGN